MNGDLGLKTGESLAGWLPALAGEHRRGGFGHGVRPSCSSGCCSGLTFLVLGFFSVFS